MKKNGIRNHVISLNIITHLPGLIQAELEATSSLFIFSIVPSYYQLSVLLGSYQS